MSAGGGASAVRTVAIAEAGYSGRFTVTNSRPDVASVSLTSEGPGSAQLTLAAQAPGTAFVTIADASGSRLTIPVTVGWGRRGADTPVRRSQPRI
jgi:hypothetical protein